MQRSAILLAAGMEAGHTDHGYQADRLTISHKLHKLLACAGGGVGGAALASDGQVMERSLLTLPMVVFPCRIHHLTELYTRDF